jgi:hypothetical protein
MEKSREVFYRQRHRYTPDRLRVFLWASVEQGLFRYQCLAQNSEAIAKAGTYIVTLKCEGEAYPESHRAHLVVGFKP